MNCTTTPHSAAELEQYVRDEGSGLTQAKQCGSVHMQMIYKPTDLLVAQELLNVSIPDSSKIRSVRERYSPYLYFVLDMAQAEGNVLYKRDSQYEFSHIL